MYDLTNVVAPPCIRDEDERGDDDRGMSRFAGKQARVRTCSKSDDTNFIKKLIRAAK